MDASLEDTWFHHDCYEDGCKDECLMFKSTDLCPICEDYEDSDKHYYVCIAEEGKARRYTIYDIVSSFASKTGVKITNLNSWYKLADACEAFNFFQTAQSIREAANELGGHVVNEVRPYISTETGDTGTKDSLLWTDGSGENTPC